MHFAQIQVVIHQIATAQINNTHLEHYNTENNWFEDTHEKNYYIVLMLSSSINN